MRIGSMLFAFVGKQRMLLALCICFACLSVLVHNAQAQAGAQAAPTAEVKENIKTGTIASTGSFGQAGAFDINTDSSPGDESNVISASVSRTTRESCDAIVTNGSPVNSYSVTFEVVGTDDRGTKAVSRSYSASLGPKASVSRTLTCGNYNMQVILKSAKKLSSRE